MVVCELFLFCGFQTNLIDNALSFYTIFIAFSSLWGAKNSSHEEKTLHIWTFLWSVEAVLYTFIIFMWLLLYCFSFNMSRFDSQYIVFIFLFLVESYCKTVLVFFLFANVCYSQLIKCAHHLAADWFVLVLLVDISLMQWFPSLFFKLQPFYS